MILKIYVKLVIYPVNIADTVSLILEVILSFTKLIMTEITVMSYA